MKRIAVIGAILENPQVCQKPFNDIVSSYKGVIEGRMGLPFEEVDMAVVSLTVAAEPDMIDDLTEKLNRLDHVTVKTAISGKTID